MFAKGKALPGPSPAKGRKIHVKKKSKKGKKRCKNPLTRGNIFGKIIKLSGRHAGTKTTKKRQWLAWKWTEKAPRKVKKVLDKITDTRYNIKAR